MATGKASDFVIYNPEFYAGMTEVEAQKVQLFNAASNGTIRLVPFKRKGEYDKQSFVDQITSTTLITRHDTADVSAATDTAMTMDEIIGVKLNKKVGPVGVTRDAWKKIGSEDGRREMSFILGQQIAEAKMADMLNHALISVEAAIDGVAALNYDHTGQSPDTLNHTALVGGMALFGDRADRIRAWVCHSAAWFDLVGNALGTAAITDVASGVVRGGSPGTFDRPGIVTDSSALTTGAGSTLQYQTLGLVENAVVVEEDTESFDIFTDVDLSLESIVYRLHGEYAYNIKVKGFKWDVGNGGANPSDATLGTTTNWDKAATQNKNLAGVHILTDA